MVGLNPSRGRPNTRVRSEVFGTAGILKQTPEGDSSAHPQCTRHSGGQDLVVMLKPQVLLDVVLIWNVAPGNSDVSACTVAMIPKLAKVPRMIPQGNQRNYHAR